MRDGAKRMPLTESGSWSSWASPSQQKCGPHGDWQEMPNPQALPPLSQIWDLREAQGLPELYFLILDLETTVVDLTLRKGGNPRKSWRSGHWDCAAVLRQTQVQICCLPSTSCEVSAHSCHL